MSIQSNDSSIPDSVKSSIRRYVDILRLVRRDRDLNSLEYSYNADDERQDEESNYTFESITTEEETLVDDIQDNEEYETDITDSPRGVEDFPIEDVIEYYDLVLPNGQQLLMSKTDFDTAYDQFTVEVDIHQPAAIPFEEWLEELCENGDLRLDLQTHEFDDDMLAEC